MNSFIGKDVMITIIEMPVQEEQVQSKEWKHAGKGKFDRNADNLNIRDLAYK